MKTHPDNTHRQELAQASDAGTLDLTETGNDYQNVPQPIRISPLSETSIEMLVLSEVTW
jgi:hypothetical protein